MESSEDLKNATNVENRLDQLPRILEEYGFAWMEDADLHNLFEKHGEDRETELFIAALNYILAKGVSYAAMQVPFT